VNNFTPPKSQIISPKTFKFQFLAGKRNFYCFGWH